MTLPDQPETELKLGADVKEHFLKVQNQATSAARIKSELLLQTQPDMDNHSRKNSRIFYLPQDMPKQRRLTDKPMFRASSRIATEESKVAHKPNQIGKSMQSIDENVLTSMCEIEDFSDDEL